MAITETELKAITDAELKNAIAYMGGRLSEMRRRNEYFYLALPKGELSPPAIEGRSKVVSTDVADTVNSMLPHLVDVFVSSERAVEFRPTRESDEVAAQQATDYVNHVFFNVNPGFIILHNWFKDALIQKGGVLKVYWNTDIEDVREVYRGLSDAELAELLSDENVEPIEHSATIEQDQMGQQIALHDITLKRRQKGRVTIENVPPEEFLVSRRAKSMLDTPFVAHRVERTLSQLKARGYKNVDSLSSDDQGTSNGERIERRSFDDELSYANNTGQHEQMDKSQRVVWVSECYMQIDYNGDGIAEWRKVVRCGNEILENEECDGHPFVFLTPEPLPHRLFGMCPADNAIEVQKTKTSLMRALLDNAYLQVNGRSFAVEGQVNLDDLLTNRPGGVVRVKMPNAVGPLQQGMSDSKTAAGLLEQMETWKENRTGWTRYSQGGDADSLNKTATGINIITNRSDQRINLIARVFAETGVKDLFRLILKLVSQNQDDQQMINVSGGWQNIDPREWKNQFDFSVNVGLGNGNKDQIVQHLTILGQAMQQAAPTGIVTPKNVYNAMRKLAQAMGFKEPELFVTDPDTLPPQQPQPDPNMMKVQIEAQKAQSDAQLQTHALQLEVGKAATSHQLAVQQADQQIQIEQLKAEVQARAEIEIERMKLDQQIQIEAMKLEAEKQKALIMAQTQKEIAEMNAHVSVQNNAVNAEYGARGAE